MIPSSFTQGVWGKSWEEARGGNAVQGTVASRMPFSPLARKAISVIEKRTPTFAVGARFLWSIGLGYGLLYFQ